MMAELVDQKYPRRRDMLMVKRRGILKNSAENRKLIGDHYRIQYRKMLEEGTKEFESWN